jgi:hypothetical protein
LDVALGQRLINQTAARTSGNRAYVAVVLPGQKVPAVQRDNPQGRGLPVRVTELRHAAHKERISDMKSRSSGFVPPPSLYTMKPARAFSAIWEAL